MKKERLFIIDNMKGILIILTVLGHLLSQCLHDYFPTDLAYIFIYLFHMPAFCLLSGFFSKNLTKDRKTCFRKLIIPYIIIYGLWYLYYLFVWDKNPSFNLFSPGYAQWYLLSLITWKLVTELFVKLKRPILISVILALLVGLIDGIGTDFSLSRTIVFFPFYLIGHYLTTEHINKIKSYNPLYAVGSLVFVLVVALIYNVASLPMSMLYARGSYELSNSNDIEGIIIRLLIYGIGVLATLAIINLTPNKKMKLTQIGVNSLIVLILHVYIIRCITFTDLFASFNLTETIIFIIISCPIIVYITSRNIFKNIFDLLFYQQNNFKKKKEIRL